MSRTILFLAMILCASTVHAVEVLLTYDLRIAATQPLGVTPIDSHTALVTAGGQVVNLELYSIVHNGDGDQTDDGFHAGQGSFVSSPVGLPATKLPGVLRGGGTPTTYSLVNNVSPFDKTGASSGAPSDYEGDGNIDDVGKNSTAAGEINDWFQAWSGADPAKGTDSANSADLSQLIGKTTFTVGSSFAGLASKVDFIPYVKLVGSPVVQNLHVFSSDDPFIDGSSGNIALRGDDPRIARIGSMIIGIPEPSSLFLGVIATIALVANGLWRRSKAAERMIARRLDRYTLLRKGHLLMKRAIFVLALLVIATITPATLADWNTTIAASNPLNWYRFDETSGSTLKDWGSQHLDGTYGTGTTNPIRGVPGLVGTGVQFIGNNEQAILHGGALITDWTAEFVIERTGTKTTQILLRGVPFAFPSTALKLEQYPDTHSVGYTQFGTADYTFSPPVATGLNKFVDLVFLRHGSQMQLYLNGQLMATNSPAINLSRDHFGSYSPGDGDTPLVVFDEAVIFNRALSADEILSHYQATIPEPSTAILFLLGIAGLIVHFRRRGK